MLYSNKKCAYQPAHSRSLNSAFIVRCLDSIIPLVSISEIASLYLASVAAQVGLSLTWSQTPRCDEAHVILSIFSWSKCVIAKNLNPDLVEGDPSKCVLGTEEYKYDIWRLCRCQFLFFMLYYWVGKWWQSNCIISSKNINVSLICM